MKKVTPEMAAEFRRLVGVCGYLCKDVAHEFGVTAQTVHRYTRDLPKRRSVRRPFSQRSRRAPGPADPEREARMVAAAREGETLARIAAVEGITRERVRQILAAYSRRKGDVLVVVRARTPAKVARPNPSLAQRLLSHAKLSQGGCWVWHGSRQVLSPGRPPRSIFRPFPGMRGPELAARHAFVLWRDPEIGTKQIVPAVCGNPDCINPFHWERRVPVETPPSSETTER